MKNVTFRLIGWSFGVLNLCLVLASCSEEPLYEHPKLSLEPAKADFGTISTQDPIAFHDVSLIARNLGSQPLHLTGMEFPDGFTYELIPRRKIIEPRESATLKITLDSRKYSAPISAEAFIFSNDPEQPRMPVELSANIVRTVLVPSSELEKAPDIRFETKSIDFGPVTRDARREFRFTFENAGKKPLVIYDVVSLCSCLTGIFPREEIPPGATNAIVALFEAYKYEGTRPWKTLRVKTNDPDEPIVQLSVAAHIIDAVIVEPEVVILPNIHVRQGAMAQVNLFQGGKDELVIRQIESSSPMISANVSPLEGDKKGYVINVEIASDMPEGKFEEVLTVFTNYGDYSNLQRETTTNIFRDYSRIRIPVKGAVSGTISVAPQKINFGSGTPGEIMQRKLLLSSSTVFFDIQELGLTDPSLRASFRAIEPRKKYEVVVEFLPELPERQIEEELIIRTSGARLTVPVLATVKTSPET